MYPYGRWQNMPEDILFGIADLVDAGDFALSDRMATMLWKFDVRDASDHRISRKMKPGLKALRETCSYWYSSLHARQGQWRLGQISLRWQSKDGYKTEESFNSIKYAIESADKSGIPYDIDIFADFRNDQALQQFGSIILLAFRERIRRLYLSNAWSFTGTLIGHDFPRLKEFIADGSPGFKPLAFGPEDRFPKLVSLEMQQWESHRLVSLIFLSQ
jgi:hypothetical protein